MRSESETSLCFLCSTRDLNQKYGKRNQIEWNGIDGTYTNCVGLSSTTRNGENTMKFITQTLKKVYLFSKVLYLGYFLFFARNPRVFTEYLEYPDAMPLLGNTAI